MREQHNVLPKTQENTQTPSDPLYRPLLTDRNELGYTVVTVHRPGGYGWACVAG